jgi:hypothetical protein
MYQPPEGRVCDGCHRLVFSFPDCEIPSCLCYLVPPRTFAPKEFAMSLVKKNRIDHFKRNKKNIKKRVKEFADQAKRINADKRAFAAKAKKK